MQQGPDWGDGAYEAFSAQLIPAAMRLVEIAAPAEGERAVDLGCGDGNATIWLARAGAQVTAVEPAERLLALAVHRCAEAGLLIDPHVGRAERLPLPDASADLIASNFAVIFSQAPVEAVGEVLRVLAPGGRFVYSAWLPEGKVWEVGQMVRRTISERLGAPAPAAAPPAWEDPASWLAELIPGGMDAISVHHGSVDFIAESGAAWNAEQSATHPMWRAARRALADDAAWEALMAQCSAILDAGSTLPEAMLVRSPYVVVEVRPQA